MKAFNCKDVDTTCDYEVTGKDENEVLAKAFEHGRKEHGMTEFPEDLKKKVLSKIRDVPSEKKEVA